MTRTGSAEAASTRALFPRLAARLPFGVLGRAFHALGTVASTQDVLRGLAESGAPEGTVVVADHQTQGRGRMGRAWLDEPGASILLSVLLRPSIAASRVPQLSLLTAVACAEALEGATGLDVRIRWPNDLEVRGRKVGGILVEAAALGEQVAYVLLGVGINVNQAALPANLAQAATSLALEAGRPLDREPLLEALLAALDRWYARYLREGFTPVREGWRRASVTLGRQVDAGGVAGVAEDLAHDGALVVRTGTGQLVRVVAGELR